jgi:hypothetical protein
MIRSAQSLFFDGDLAGHRLVDSDELDGVWWRCAQVFSPHRLMLQGQHRRLDGIPFPVPG